MAVILVSAPHQYRGLSSDVKPTDGTIPIGSTITMDDTGQVSVWTGSAWIGQTPAVIDVTAAQALAVLAREAVATRQLTELMSEIEIADLDLDDAIT